MPLDNGSAAGPLIGSDGPRENHILPHGVSISMSTLRLSLTCILVAYHWPNILDSTPPPPPTCSSSPGRMFPGSPSCLMPQTILLDPQTHAEKSR